MKAPGEPCLHAGYTRLVLSPDTMKDVNVPPVRLCCGRRHYSVMCPDGKIMCCLCSGRFTPEELHTDADGQREDVCKGCGDAETAAMKKKKRSTS